METTQHFGIYGLWRHEARLVLVRKSRGPYTGLLDLPGGTPEPGETVSETLARELREETGLRLTGSSEPHHVDIHVTANSSSRAIDLVHRGWIAEVQVEGTLRSDIDAEDVNGIVLAEGLAEHQLSPLAVEALRLVTASRVDDRGTRAAQLTAPIAVRPLTRPRVRPLAGRTALWWTGRC